MKTKDGRCLKCGSTDDPFVRYCPGRVGSFGMCQRQEGVEDDLLGLSDEGEHLHATCSSCGYRFVSPTWTDLQDPKQEWPEVAP